MNKIKSYNYHSETELSGFYVVYDGATWNEKPGFLGLSHLCEHLVCKGLDPLQDAFQQHGIRWNAATSDNEVYFYMTGLDKYVKKYMDVFLESLLNVKITREQFLTERKIVLEEYDNDFNIQEEAHLLNLCRKLFGLHRPIGLRKDLEKLKLPDFRDFQNTWFRQPSRIFTVSGSCDNHSVCHPMPAGMNGTDVRYLPSNPFVFEKTSEFHEKSSVILLSSVITSDFPVVYFICAMLGSGLKSPLYDEIREKRGLVYYISCNMDRLSNQAGLVMIDTITANENAMEVIDLVRMVLEKKEKYLTRERFQVIRESILIHLRIQEINRHQTVVQYFKPWNWQLESIIHDLTLEEVYRVYDRYFSPESLYISIDKEEFKGL
ncbi:MAG: insulinase family protein [Bacteroidetes bacterium]|nr:insulinase family protein [Bacteroidota bacterium]